MALDSLSFVELHNLTKQTFGVQQFDWHCAGLKTIAVNLNCIPSICKIQNLFLQLIHFMPASNQLLGFTNFKTQLSLFLTSTFIIKSSDSRDNSDSWAWWISALVLLDAFITFIGIYCHVFEKILYGSALRIFTYKTMLNLNHETKTNVKNHINHAKK
jgi:hypothetical protein